MNGENAVRKGYLDALRILGCALAVYYGVASRGMQPDVAAATLGSLFHYYLSKSFPALFLLISGALLLGRCDSYKKTGLRILRLALALSLFSLFYYWMECLEIGKAFELTEFFRRLLNERLFVSAWYAYAFLGILLLLPLLQRLSMRMTRKDYGWYLVWALLFTGMMPILAEKLPSLQINGSFHLVLFTVPLGLVMLGRYADGTERQSWWLTVLFAVGVLLLTGGPALLTWRRPQMSSLFDGFYLPTVVGTALCLFFVMRRLLAGVEEHPKASRALAAISRLQVCTYFLAEFLTGRIWPLWESLAPGMGVLGANIVVATAVFFAGMVLSFVLTRIPGLKKII